MPRYIDADILYKEVEIIKVQAEKTIKNADSMSTRMIATTQLVERENFGSLICWMRSADVVPRSEVEGVQKRLNDYKRVCGELHFTECGNAIFEVGRGTDIKVEYIPTIINNIRVREAKQEVARAMLDDINNIAYMNENGDFCLDRADFAELEKKYIGE